MRRTPACSGSGRRSALESRRRAGGEGCCVLSQRCDVGDAARRRALPGVRRPNVATLHAGARIDACRVRHQQAAPFGAESDARLRSRRTVRVQFARPAVAPPSDRASSRLGASAERLYGSAIGNLVPRLRAVAWRFLFFFFLFFPLLGAGGSALCRERFSRRHPSRLSRSTRREWQGSGRCSAPARCMSACAAERMATTRRELVEIEAYLAQRAAGLKIETPAVRP